MKFDCQNENINEINFEYRKNKSYDLKKNIVKRDSVILNSISIYD